MTTIKQWSDVLKDQSIELVRERLDQTLEQIKFLESIYQTGGANAFFSKKFQDAAYQERQELCQLSSACYSFLRKQNVKI